MLPKKRLSRIKNNHFLTTIQNTIQLTCDRAEFNSQTRVLTLDGHVNIQQSDQWASCDTLIYDDINEILTLTGHIQVAKNSRDILKCDELILDLKKESFEARKSVHSIFHIKKTKRL